MSSWLGQTSFPRIPFPGRTDLKTDLGGDLEGRHEATAILQLSDVAIYLLPHLVGINQQPDLYLLHFPLDPPPASPTPGPGVCVQLCEKGLGRFGHPHSPGQRQQ